MIHAKRKLARNVVITGIAVLAMYAAPVFAQRGEDNPSSFANQYKQQNHGNNHDNNGCSHYRLTADGGDGGMRLMSNQGDFHRASNGSVTGRLCARGRQTIELSKRDQNARVILEIDGREYNFRHGDRGDKQANNWFRQYFNVDL